MIRVLNRIGVCSSADTLATFIQCKLKERERSGPEEECSHKFSTLITIDNIDFQHSYARVFCGKQTSSWHGTTVQAVQPRLHTPQHHSQHNSMQVNTHEVYCIETSSTCSTATHGECTAGNEIMHTGHRQPECVAAEKLF